jgi:hypothetical protein
MSVGKQMEDHMEQGTFFKFLALLAAMGVAALVWALDMEAFWQNWFTKPDQYEGMASALRLAALFVFFDSLRVVIRQIRHGPKAKQSRPTSAPAHMRNISAPAKIGAIITKRRAA